MNKYRRPTLTIAGSDSSGGAGIQADLKTFAAIGTYGMSVITSVTAQNTMGVIDVEDLSCEIIRKQIDAVFNDIRPKATKIGMVSNTNIIKEIVYSLKRHEVENLVLDPVMISKSGYSLLKTEAKEALINSLMPLARIVTPNVPEAEEITSLKIEDLDSMRVAADKILMMGPEYVLIKGGHLEGDAIDLLVWKDGSKMYKSERICRKNTHGTGCTLSSAITAYLALGYEVDEAVLKAKKYITEAIEHSFDIGKGIGPVHHFYNWDKE